MFSFLPVAEQRFGSQLCLSLIKWSHSLPFWTPSQVHKSKVEGKTIPITERCLQGPKNRKPTCFHLQPYQHVTAPASCAHTYDARERKHKRSRRVSGECAESSGLPFSPSGCLQLGSPGEHGFLAALQQEQGNPGTHKEHPNIVKGLICEKWNSLCVNPWTLEHTYAWQSIKSLWCGSFYVRFTSFSTTLTPPTYLSPTLSFSLIQRISMSSGNTDQKVSRHTHPCTHTHTLTKTSWHP